MSNKLSFLLCIVILLKLIHSSYGDRTKDKMYINIKGAYGCYRRMNATHQIGCSSKWNGSTGVVHFCRNISDLNFILKTGNAGPYIPVIPVDLFTISTLKKLKSSTIISGLVLHKLNKTKLSNFTHDKQCPNERYGVQGTCNKNESPIWNPHGTGIMFEDIPFPMFFLENDEEVLKIKKCFDKFNDFSYENQRERSLCSLQLKSFMYAATNTITCRRRSNIITNINPVKFCDPLGDYNIWSSLFPVVTGPRNESVPLKSKYIIVSARLDTTSLFETMAGAESPVTGLVTLLSVAKYLKTILPEYMNEYNGTNVLFILFNGETYDYIGSSRMLYDMENGNFPVKTSDGKNDFLPVIRPENISLFIELSQLKNVDTLYAHFFKSNDKIEKILSKLKTSSEGTGLHIKTLQGSLPPSSLHTFVKKDPNFPGLVIADHEKYYVNNFYNSIYDNASNIDFVYNNISDAQTRDSIGLDTVQQHVAYVAEIVSKAVFEEVTGEKYTGPENVDVGLVDELFHCYLENPNCRVHKAVNMLKLPKTPLSLYVGVDVSANLITNLIALTLGWLTADIVGDSNINCTSQPRNYVRTIGGGGAYTFHNYSKSIYDLNSTKCYRVTCNQTEAISPAFLIEDYDWSSGKYSSWSESTWNEITMKVFLKPSPAHQTATITIGAMVMILSFVVVYFFKSSSHILFSPVSEQAPPTQC